MMGRSYDDGYRCTDIDGWLAGLIRFCIEMVALGLGAFD
jgi:hypothetical protein